MKARSAAPLTLCALLASFALIAPRASSADEREVVMQVTQRACDAFRMADLAAVERLLAPEFTLVNSDASVQTRADVIAEIRGGDPKYEVFRNHSMTAHVFGDAAIVQGITSLKGTSGGKPFAADVRFTDTLIKSKGEWRLVVSHVTRMPAPAQSSYAGEEQRDIKSLSEAERADLLAGKGMGLAKVAELNGHPGPRHVLDLASELELSAEQKAATEAVFAKMQHRASALGAQIIEAERSLDTLFQSSDVQSSRLDAVLARIGALNAELRGAHLSAHLEQTKLLSSHQVARYNELRGYSRSGGGDHSSHAHHGHEGH